ncbi:hypothetical protein J3A83DRAFT_3197663 [Scleroderma citrinum]
MILFFFRRSGWKRPIWCSYVHFHLSNTSYNSGVCMHISREVVQYLKTLRYSIGQFTYLVRVHVLILVWGRVRRCPMQDVVIWYIFARSPTADALIVVIAIVLSVVLDRICPERKDELHR